jgi:alpha-L-arabinofuranosidase
MKRHILCPFAFSIATAIFTGCAPNDSATLTIDLTGEGVEVPQDLWGIFYEEINRAGDGGLWPEMIYNMGFEEKNIPADCTVEDGAIVAPAKPNYTSGVVKGFRFYHFDPDNLSEGWSLESGGSSRASMAVVVESPLHPANPHSLRLDISDGEGAVKLINEGFRGISLVGDEQYDLSFHLRAAESYKGKVVVSLIGSQGETIFSQEYDVDNSGAWKNYATEITSPATDNGAKLTVEFTSPGRIWVDYVSLMPRKTFMGHGLRQDIAQTLADLKPSFIRWPGGCIVEGISMENRVRWKESIGDRIARPGQFDMWGYHNSYNFGYHEFLQFCEDVGATGMYVANAGLSCTVRNGDYYEMDELDVIIDDILDAIEYAIGGTDTEWGAERAKNGHPEPFPLKYVEIGNENVGAMYAERYNVIYAACKARYPQIVYINDHSQPGQLPEWYAPGSVEMIDPHYYVRPETFFNTVHLYDDAPRGLYDVYIGEYAVNSGVGSGTLEGALAEAAFMFGIEHNSDLVKIASYAPLLENVNWVHWPTNLIRFKNDAVFGRSSYHVQKMFNENKPSVTLDATLRIDAPPGRIVGRSGFAANVSSEQADIRFRNFTVTKGSTAVFSSADPAAAAKWTETGSWQKIDGGYAPGALTDLSHLSAPGLYIPGNRKDAPARLTAGGWLTIPEETGDSFVIDAQVAWENVFTPFSIRFGVKDENNYLAVRFSVPRRRNSMPQTDLPPGYTAVVEQVVNGTTLEVGTLTSTLALEEGKWHDIRVTVEGAAIGCSVDGVAIGEAVWKPLERRFAVAGYDRQAGEVIVKVVNAVGEPLSTRIELSNALEVEPVGTVITLSSASLKDDNSFEEPSKVSPVAKEFDRFGKSFSMLFEPNSFTILRIKAIIKN